MKLHFVSNSEGMIIAVQLPLREWEEVERRLEAMKIANSVKAGIQEAQQIENGKLTATTLDEFLVKPPKRRKLTISKPEWLQDIGEDVIGPKNPGGVNE